jgi:hypothetical protein
MCTIMWTPHTNVRAAHHPQSLQNSRLAGCLRVGGRTCGAGAPFRAGCRYPRTLYYEQVACGVACVRPRGAKRFCCRKTRARCRELIQGTAGRASAGPALRKPPEALCRGSPSRLATRPNQSLLPRPQQPPGRAARPVHAHRTQNPGRAFGHTSEQGACTVATRAEHVRSRPTGLRRLLASPRLYFSPRDCLSGAPACKFPTISRISTFRLTKDSI